jgi:hypothetical protein
LKSAHVIGTTPSRLFREAPADVGWTTTGRCDGFEVVEGAALSARSNATGAVVLRCASIRRAGRRSTTGRVRASSARRRSLQTQSPVRGDRGRKERSPSSGWAVCRPARAATERSCVPLEQRGCQALTRT